MKNWFHYQTILAIVSSSKSLFGRFPTGSCILWLSVVGWFWFWWHFYFLEAGLLGPLVCYETLMPAQIKFIGHYHSRRITKVFALRFICPGGEQSRGSCEWEISPGARSLSSSSPRMTPGPIIGKPLPSLLTAVLESRLESWRWCQWWAAWAPSLHPLPDDDSCEDNYDEISMMRSPSTVLTPPPSPWLIGLTDGFAWSWRWSSYV